jgi:hypothetical protein
MLVEKSIPLKTTSAFTLESLIVIGSAEAAVLPLGIWANIGRAKLGITSLPNVNSVTSTTTTVLTTANLILFPCIEITTYVTTLKANLNNGERFSFITFFKVLD